MPTPEKNEWRMQFDAQMGAFRAGYRAAQEGESVEMCPYTGNHYAIRWQEGWHAAVEDGHANP